jgi:glycosyltransferase involved in cell wall biosynthesis
VLYHDVAVHNGAQPNKLFEYMSAGLPVVASNFSLWRDIVEKPKCGILVDPMNTSAVAEAICWLLEHPKEAEAMGRRGAKVVSQIFNWNSEAEKLLQLYGNLIPSAMTK